jgi:hypothetical protein
LAKRRRFNSLTDSWESLRPECLEKSYAKRFQRCNYLKVTTQKFN